MIVYLMVKGIIAKKLDAKFLVIVFDFAGRAFLELEKHSEIFTGRIL